MRIAVINCSYVQQLGAPKKIYDNPAYIFVASFMESPSISLIPARADAGKGGMYAEVAIFHGTVKRLRFSGGTLAGQAGRRVILGIGPLAFTDFVGADRKINRRPDSLEPGRRDPTGRFGHVGHFIDLGQGMRRSIVRRCPRDALQLRRVRHQHGKCVGSWPKAWSQGRPNIERYRTEELGISPERMRRSPHPRKQ